MRRAAGLALLFMAAGCGQNIPTNPALPNTSQPYLAASGNNVLPLKVGGGAVCGQASYPNELCTTVTVCMPGTTQCATVSDILVDTGSVGLRVFPSALGFSLPQLTDSSGNTYAECAQFGTGSDWGPMATADVMLGNEPKVTVPVQLINSAFASVPSACAQSDTSPTQAGYNGILGVGPFTDDCGSQCASQSANNFYYSCASGGACTPIALPEPQQLQNPVFHLPTDNNGILVALPQVGAGGAATVSGMLILGIGTQSNNAPTGVNPYSVDPNGNFTTNFQGVSIPGSFIDTGSNAYLFPNVTGIPDCPSSGSSAGFYCPGSIQSYTAYNLSLEASVQAQVPFQIENTPTLLGTSNSAFSTLGGESPGLFDWGLPFFYGRAVFVGITGSSSPLGTGPYFAY